MRIHLFRTVLAVLACAVFVGPSADVAAQEGPKSDLFLLPTSSVRDSITSIVPERIGEMLREQVGKDGRVVLMPAYAEVRQSLGGASAAIAQAETLYTSGIGLLTAGEDKKAAETFQRAVDLMEQNITDVKNYDVLADALANLALAYHNGGFDVDGRKRMQQYADMRPDATLDPDKFPKALIQVFDDEVKKVKAAGPGQLQISSTPEGAKVLIDGVEKGVTPMTVSDVGRGYHYLVVTNGASSWSETIRVRGKKKKQTYKAELGNAAPSGKATDDGAMPSFLTDLQSTIKSGQYSAEELAPYLKELAAQTGAEFVAWVIMYKEGGGYVAAPFAYRASDGSLVQGADTKFNIELSNLLVGVSALSQSVVELSLKMPKDKAVTSVTLGGPPPAVSEKPTGDTTTGVATKPAEEPKPIEPPPTPPEKSAGGNTWTYVGIAAGGLAVVGLVAGGIYLLAGDGGAPAPGFNTEVTW